MAKEAQEKLDAQVQIRMTKTEKAKLLKEAQQMHLKLSSYARYKLLGNK